MDINIDSFLFNFALQFDETPIDMFQITSVFREFEEWSSLTALLIIAMVDDTYKVKLTGIELKDCNTIEDLYKVIIAKISL